MRTDNEELARSKKELEERVRELEQQVGTQTSALTKMQNQQAKGTIERLPPIGNSSSLAEAVKEYLKDKEQVHRITRSPVTKLERLLGQLRPKMWNWNVGNLLEEIDKWVEGIKEKEGGEVDMWRIRSSIARRFSEFMDQPDSLTKPSRASQGSIGPRSGQSLWGRL
jgi:hypothetical protein